ncbi:unnamed protein product [Soboliphyme baturini]|uniref:Peptidase S1 domain-containing protein n=1 Tax=Soboliphyme baturini TaxID=241478 RepID=A0A183IXT3_9BILA|nr:unnamed protein product [Soboliphyme baturini]
MQKTSDIVTVFGFGATWPVLDNHHLLGMCYVHMRQASSFARIKRGEMEPLAQFQLYKWGTIAQCFSLVLLTPITGLVFLISIVWFLDSLCEENVMGLRKLELLLGAQDWKDASENVQIVHVRAVIIKQGGFSGMAANDLSLIEIRERVVLTKSVKPAQIPGPEDLQVLSPGVRFKVFGVENQTSSRPVRSVEVVVKEFCTLQKFELEIGRDKICAVELSRLQQVTQVRSAGQSVHDFR